jgi:Peptidase family M28
MAGPGKFRGTLTAVVFSLAWGLFSTSALGQIEFRSLKPDEIQARLESFSEKNDEREATIKRLFVASGCKPDNLSEQWVTKKLPPNVICILPGATERIILVGAHTDHVEEGDGVVDNWSGASLLPSLLYSLSAKPRQHTFVFVGFTAEEQGMVGSEFYTAQLTKQQRSLIDGMVNLDTLGLGPTKVWASHADKPMLEAVYRAAAGMQLSIGAVNFEQVGTTDSESFARLRIPRITIHTITQQTWPILHSKKDSLQAVRMDDYYASYRLMAGYLALLDSSLGEPPAPHKGH